MMRIKTSRKMLASSKKIENFHSCRLPLRDSFPTPACESTVDESRKAQCLTQTSLNRGRLVPEVTLAFLPSQQCSTSCC